MSGRPSDISKHRRSRWNAYPFGAALQILFLETKIYDKSRAAEKEEGSSYKQRVECVGEPHGWCAVLVVGFAVVLLEALHKVAAGSEREEKKKRTIFLYYEFPIL